ncbi:hypothetical protein NS263_15500 [Curtobacterium oceanosedimentum]|uniref:DUF4064 domain-containing protein n=1 Tax=Curtobacterium oceanosedimentum TaxID=465820 RepID=A0ABR5S3F2_9MICO|nr:DUF4064 domain-containing protein [Curtobacterium oceanosedimentum]KTR37510.1 hypothetical protein NS263_15500 [Curtobacterium oceanosedimentum]
MTNDDRSNEDRTGDGTVPGNTGGPGSTNAPAWGSAPQHDRQDAPRYGERVDPAPGSAPQYGERDQGQPQYGQQQYGERSGYDHQQYGQQQYGERGGYDQRDGRPDSPTWGEHQGTHQPYAASSAPASAGSPTWQSYEEPKPAKKKKTVGVIAFALGILSLVLGVVGGAVLGAAFAGNAALAEIARNGGSSVQQQEQMQQQLMNDPAALSQFGGGSIVVLIAAVLGLWALVQGIIAAVAGRGRVWGVLAIILAVVATFATFIAVTVAAAAAVTGSN